MEMGWMTLLVKGIVVEAGVVRQKSNVYLVKKERQTAKDVGCQKTSREEDVLWFNKAKDRSYWKKKWKRQQRTQQQEQLGPDSKRGVIPKSLKKVHVSKFIKVICNY